MTTEIDRMLDRREIRRFKSEERAVSRLDRLWDRAEALVGELCRDGRTVYYITTNLKTGKTKENTCRAALIDWAIRYRYVS